jgi:adenosylmethionine-8-amino-7-oxononanoate aminotransferase
MSGAAGEKSIQERAKAHIWYPYTQMKDWEKEEPLVISRGEGFYLYDVDGKRYIDGHSSLWVNLFGHNHPRLISALKRQAELLDHSTLLGLTHPQAIFLAEKLTKIVSPHLKKVFFSDNGSTAMEIGLKMAFQYWLHKGEPQRKKFLTFSGNYHGDTIGAVSIGGIDLFHGPFRPLLFTVLKARWPYPYRDPFFPDDPEKVKNRCLEEAEEILYRHKEEICAIVAESRIQGAQGMIVAPEGFMPALSSLAKKYGVLFILDEVATGFLRTGKLFALHLEEGIDPDIVALAKGLSGGILPIAATLTTQEIYNAFLGEYHEFKTFFHGHTYTGNPIACAVALETLSLIEDSGILSALPRKISYFKDLLLPFREHPFVGEVRQLGMMVGIELVANKETKEFFDPAKKIPQKIVKKARELGAIIRPLGNVMVLMPPPAIPEEVLKDLVEITYKAIDFVTKKDGS